MEDTYRQPLDVLVIDKGITACDTSDIPVYEAWAQISSSAWLQRVWTLQGGVLAADRFWFQFGDRAVNLKSLTVIHDPTRFRIVTWLFADDIMRQY